MKPSNLALIGWSLARTKLPWDAPLFRKLKSEMLKYLIQYESALLNQENKPSEVKS